DRLCPQVESDHGSFHRVIGDALLVLDEAVPVADELLVGRYIDAHEVVPGRQVADQRAGVDTGQLFFTHREGDDRNVFGGDLLVTQFLVERHVGIAVDGGDHSGFLAGGTKLLDVRNDALPVGMAERGVVDHDVPGIHTLALQVGLKDLVGGTRVNIVGT